MKKTARFGMVLTPETKQALEEIARWESIPEAAVVRRLILREAERLGIVSSSFKKENTR